MLAFISSIFTIIIPLHAIDRVETYSDVAVCQSCTPGVPSQCPTQAPGGESCQTIHTQFGYENICYWDDESEINVAPGTYFTRECSSDHDCARFIETWEFPDYNPDYFLNLNGGVHLNSCLRCCDNGAGTDVCTQTLSEGDICGTLEWFDNNNANINSYGFNFAPCCAGETCIDPVLGVCGVEAAQCETCISWNSQTINFDDTVNRLDNCADELICLLDDGPGADVSLNDISYLTYGYGEFFGETYFHADIHTPAPTLTRRRLPEGHIEGHAYHWGVDYNIEYHIRNLRPHVTVRKGICVPEDGVDATDTTCVTDENCPKCMRCCAGAGTDGSKQCVRSSGDMCGLTFEGRGPCCCPEYTCKANQCITQSPTPSPSDVPSKALTGDDSGGSGDSDDNSEMFGADKMVGLKDENEQSDSEFIFQISEKTLINLWGIVIISIIALIICGYFCVYRKKEGHASFRNDMDEMNQNV